MNDNEQDVKIEVKFDEDVAAGKFTNFSNITHSPDEFIIDFIFVTPSPPPGFGKLVSRLVLTPSHAKRLMLILTENIKNYEERMGEISVNAQLLEPGKLQ